jgi:uncharacterized protein YpmS
MEENDSTFIDWRWLAVGALAIVGLLASGIMALHVAAENARNQAQDTRLESVEKQVNTMRDQVGAIPVMDVKLNVANKTLDKIEVQLDKLLNDAMGQAAVRDDRERKK